MGLMICHVTVPYKIVGAISQTVLYSGIHIIVRVKEYL